MSARRETRADPVERARAVSVEQTAEIMGQSDQTIRRLIRRGELPHLRVGRRLILLEDDVYRFLRDRRVPAR